MDTQVDLKESGGISTRNMRETLWIDKAGSTFDAIIFQQRFFSSQSCAPKSFFSGLTDMKNLCNHAEEKEVL